MYCVRYAGEKPIEEDLRRHIIAHVGKDWKPFLSYLGVPAITIEHEVENNQNNVKEAFFQSLRWWHKGNSKDHPSTWEELLQALEKAELTDHADELRQKLLNYEI